MEAINDKLDLVIATLGDLVKDVESAAADDKELNKHKGKIIEKIRFMQREALVISYICH